MALLLITVKSIVKPLDFVTFETARPRLRRRRFCSTVRDEADRPSSRAIRSVRASDSVAQPDLRNRPRIADPVHCSVSLDREPHLVWLGLVRWAGLAFVSIDCPTLRAVVGATTNDARGDLRSSRPANAARASDRQGSSVTRGAARPHRTWSRPRIAPYAFERGPTTPPRYRGRRRAIWCKRRELKF